MRAVREALIGFRRAPLLGGLSVVAIGLSLLILGLFGLSAYNVDQAISDVERRVEVVAYLLDDAGEERARTARREIGGFPEVEEVRYVSRTEALVTASRELPEFSELFADLDVNPLPASLEIRLRPGYRDPAHVEAVAERVAAYEFVDDVRYGQGWVERIFLLRRIAAGTALILGGAFAAVAILLIGTAVRIAILARSEEIAIMRTVGATNAYIQRPFLLEGLLTGLAGGLLALGLTRLAWFAVDESFLRIAWLPDLWAVGGVAAAALLGMGAAGYAVRRELRRRHAL